MVFKYNDDIFCTFPSTFKPRYIDDVVHIIVKSYLSQYIYDENKNNSDEMAEVIFHLITAMTMVIIMISMIRVDVKMPLDICLASHVLVANSNRLDSPTINLQ